MEKTHNALNVEIPPNMERKSAQANYVSEPLRNSSNIKVNSQTVKNSPSFGSRIRFMPNSEETGRKKVFKQNEINFNKQ